MIRTASAKDIIELFHRVLVLPERYKEVIVCSPFICRRIQAELVYLQVATRRAQCALSVITSPSVANELIKQLPARRGRSGTPVVSITSLHAKVYVAVARRRKESRAIVTSANLTNAGISRNVEIGTICAPTTDAGSHLFSQTASLVRSLMGRGDARRASWSKGN